jgi:hypothetical protein
LPDVAVAEVIVAQPDSAPGSAAAVVAASTAVAQEAVEVGVAPAVSRDWVAKVVVAGSGPA